MKSEIAELNKDIGEIKEELQKAKKALREIELNLTEKDIKLKEYKIANKTLIDKMTEKECKLLEKQLRMRNVPDKKIENIFDKIVEITVDMLNTLRDEIEYNIEEVYRVNSMVARQRGLLRDIVVKLLLKKTPEG